MKLQGYNQNVFLIRTKIEISSYYKSQKGY